MEKYNWGERQNQEAGGISKYEEAAQDGVRRQVEVSSIHRSAVFENQADIWLTTQEAADFLRISAKSLLNLTSNGRIPYFKFGRRNRFLLRDLQKALLGQPRGGFHGN